jgi:hypothetical protein
MATLDEILSGRNLTKMVQEVKSGLKLAIPDAMLTPTDTVSGNTFEYLKVDGNRDLARLVARDAPARRVGQQGVSRQVATLLDSRESQAFSGNSLLNMINMEVPAQKQRMGEQEVMRQTVWFKKRQINLMQTLAQMMLFQFKIHADKDGNILPSSSGAYVTVDAGVPSGQTGQLDILGGGAIIGASWATSSTDILGHLESIKEQMFTLGGWEIKNAFYGKNIPKYVFANDVAKNWINQNQQLSAAAFRANAVPEGFQDLNWHEAGSNVGWFSANGTFNKFVGDDEIVFTPEVSDDWWRMVHGSNAIAMGPVRRGGEAGDMLADIEEVFGPYSYAEILSNPTRIEQFTGVTFLPLVTATKAVCRCDVTP